MSEQLVERMRLRTILNRGDNVHPAVQGRKSLVGYGTIEPFILPFRRSS
jgi:hypothetical protein